MSALPPGFCVRPPTPADAPTVSDLCAAMDVAVQGSSDTTPEEVLDDFQDLDLEREAWLVEDDAGRTVGYAGLLRRRRELPLLDGYVHPDAWGRGIGGALIAMAESRAREVAAGGIRNVVLAGDAAARRLLAEADYREARHFFRMIAALEGLPPAPEWPDGVEAAAFDPADARAVRAALDEAFAEEWDYEPESFELWEERRLKSPGCDPGLWFVARENGAIAGVIVCDAKKEDMGWVGLVGVRPPWRRRGLGLALLRQAFAEFYRRGERRVGLGVDASNPTGATRLYERAGMQVAWEAVIYEKELRAR